MARGWESKSVEDQVAAAQAEAPAADRRSLSPEQVERYRKRDVLRSTHALITQQLRATDNPRYRTLLEQELASVEAQLQTLEDR